MDAELFLEYLPWLRQPKYLSKMLGLSSNYDEWLVKDTTPVRRVHAIKLVDAPTSIQVLFSENSLENLRFINGISFWSEPKQLDQGWGFADMSEVNLVVAPSGLVEAYNAHPIRDMPGATDCLGVLAKDLESFLEALFCAQFNQSTFLRGSPDENPIQHEKTVLVAKHCALIAGGYEYYDFWAGLLGLPPTETVPE
jgi:hypothetical protein